MTVLAKILRLMGAPLLAILASMLVQQGGYMLGRLFAGINGEGVSFVWWILVGGFSAWAYFGTFKRIRPNSKIIFSCMAAVPLMAFLCLAAFGSARTWDIANPTISYLSEVIVLVAIPVSTIRKNWTQKATPAAK